MSAKLVPAFAERGCRVVSETDPHGRILIFLNLYFHVTPSALVLETLTYLQF
jgi:hypothetical protein